MELLLGLVLLTPLVNWPVFIVLSFIPGTPGKALQILRWRSLGIALLSTAYVFLMIAPAVNIKVSGDWFTVLLTVPLFLMTAVNAVFLWLFLRGKW